MSTALRRKSPEAGLHCYWQEQQILSDVQHAKTFWARLKGLLGRKELALHQGILLEPCHSVHTLGMKFEIAVIFLDRENRILHLIPHMPPGKLSPVISKARKVLECHPDLLAQYSLQVGTALVVKSA